MRTRKLNIDTEALKQNGRPHLMALDGLRGLAAFIVVMGHLKLYGIGTPVFDDARNYGVLIFFSLSGFLMAYLYLEQAPSNENVFSYIVARIARIVPLYYLTVLLAWIVYQFINHGFVYNVTNVQLVRLLTFNGSTASFWSIGPEFQFYFIFAVLWLVWHRPLGKLVGGLLMVGLSALAILEARHIPGILFLSKAHIFIFGICAALLFTRIRLRTHWMIIAGAQLVTLAGLLLILFPQHLLFNAFYPPHPRGDINLAYFYGSFTRCIFASFIVLSFAFSTGLSRVIFENAAMRWLGNISFSLYLLHEPIIYGFIELGGVRAFGPRVSIFAILILCAAIASLSYKFIEVPGRRSLRKNVLMSRFKSVLESSSRTNWPVSNLDRGGP